MPEPLSPVGIRLGTRGSLAVPADLCEALGFKPGDSFIARAQNGRLIVESRESAVRRLQERFGTPGRSLADELIAERRLEASRE